ncbi:hypothetical protein YTPLAS18_19520 [Nitrospira sp.]|nr:hypothetical protein YTPLAS18_19520 [Nitrospira sp.]
MDLSEQREHPRFWVDLPVLFATPESWGVGLKPGSMFNLSQGGCAVASLAPVPIGSMLTLFVQTSQGKLLLKVDQAHVRWATVGEFGLQFQQLRPDARERLQLFLAYPR